MTPPEESLCDMAFEMEGSWIGPCRLEHFFENMHALLRSEGDIFTPLPPSSTPSSYFWYMCVSSERELLVRAVLYTFFSA